MPSRVSYLTTTGFLPLNVNTTVPSSKISFLGFLSSRFLFRSSSSLRFLSSSNFEASSVYSWLSGFERGNSLSGFRGAVPSVVPSVAGGALGSRD